MKNFKKILPAVALASAGIIAVAGAGNASAYSYEQLKGYHNGVAVADGNPENVAICYTLSNVTIPVATTFTIGLSSNELDMSKVSATSANDTTYTSSSTTTGGFTITFTTSDFSSSSSATKCAHLNFGTALSSTAAFGNYSVDLGVPSSSNDDVPVDFTSGKEISFGYQLSTDTNGYPTTNSSTGVYQAEYWIKSAPTLESSMITSYGHIEVSKKVKGNAANPDESFAFTANVTKLYPSITDTGYNIYVNGSSVKTCAFGTDCVFNLKHGQTAYIGCSSSNCQNDGQLVVNGYNYTITESNTKGHTPYVDGDTTSTNTTGSKTLDSELKEHEFVNEKTNTIAGRFFNILPFIILAALATVGVVTLRKANKKNEA